MTISMHEHERVAPSRDWRVLLVGGASGVGKTKLARSLARHYRVNLVEVDDVQVILERTTTPEQQPPLHFWRTNWAAFSAWSIGAQRQHFLRVAREVFAPALEAVIARHLEDGQDMILEGDYLLPELALLDAYETQPNDGRVRSLFVLEDDEAQIASNYLEREGVSQPDRARTSWDFGQWIRHECERLGVPFVAARPWNTVTQRTVDALERGDAPTTERTR
jgi:2-phosphoglycerate kinase